MGALVIAILSTLLGAFIGGVLARRFALASVSGAAQPARLARAAVSLLGVLAGGEIAAQLYTLVHSLQLNAGLDKGFGGRLLDEVNLADIVEVLHGVMFYGALLAGLAAAVAMLAANRRARSSESAAPPSGA